MLFFILYLFHLWWATKGSLNGFFLGTPSGLIPLARLIEEVLVRGLTAPLPIGKGVSGRPVALVSMGN